MGGRQAHSQGQMCIASVDCAYGQEEAFTASCGDLLSCEHEGGEGLGSFTLRVACLSLTALLCPKLEQVTESRFHQS